MSDTTDYDLVILGGGAAAFAAITEAGDRKLSTAIVNTGLPLGGTCVNVGCVPSKHLLAVGESAFEPPRNPFDAVGYGENEPTVDWNAALDEKDALVSRLRRENYVDVAEHFETDIYEGFGRLVDDTTIEVVDGPDAGTHIAGTKVLLATGSSPRIPPIDGLEDVDYQTSETILEEHDLPESIVIIGGGYVALEWGQILHRVGVDVTILQRSERVLSDMEEQLGREIQRIFRKEGISVVTGTDVRRIRAAAADGGVESIQQSVAVETLVEGERRTVRAEDVFVATGVRPNSEDIGLEAADVETNADGTIRVDEHFRTTNPEVYAAGDVIGAPELETVAAKEGNHAITNAFGSAERSRSRDGVAVSRDDENSRREFSNHSAGRSSGRSPREDNEGKRIDYDAVPAVVFTSPEIASVGITELKYTDEHGTCSCRTIRMEDTPKAKAVKDTRGLLQVVKHHETDEIVGVHMVGPRAADMITEATLAVKFGLTIDDIIDTIHPFPTFSEAIKHACQAFRRDPGTMSCCVE